MTSAVASHLLRCRIALSRIDLSLAASLPQTDAQAPASQLRTVKLHVLLEADLAAHKTPVQFVRDGHGEIKPRQIYVASADGSQALLLLPSDGPRKLAAHTPGTAHVATQAGAVVAAAVLGFASFEKRTKVELFIGEGLQQKIGNERAHFLLGFLQRSVNTKLKHGVAFSRTDEKSLPVVADAAIFSEQDWILAHDLNDAMLTTRSLVNMPANMLNSETYEVFVRELVREECERSHDPTRLNIEVFRVEKLQQDGCGLICAVGQGSSVSPRILKITYTPKDSRANVKTLKHVVLVGKGITFDTGGLDMKGSAFMRNMKKDMGGSAAALGTFLAVTRAGLPLRVTCYLALAENMVSGNAMRPGDVYTAKNGVSVEIDNTDAEGRLVLADTLVYAAEEKPDWILDLATLTGAARVALGPSVDAVFSNESALEQLLVSTGIEVGDWVWNLPLVADYESWLDSNVADLVNSASSGHGGAITAALFLKRFVNGVPWSHIDTYMWADKPTELTQEPGATAKCVRLLARALAKFAHMPAD